MNYLKILKKDSFWFIMLGFVFGVFLAHEFVFEQIDSDWVGFYEISWHPVLAQIYVLISHLVALLSFIVMFLLLMTVLGKAFEIVGEVIGKLWEHVKTK